MTKRLLYYVISLLVAIIAVNLSYNNVFADGVIGLVILVVILAGIYVDFFVFKDSYSHLLNVMIVMLPIVYTIIYDWRNLDRNVMLSIFLFVFIAMNFALYAIGNDEASFHRVPKVEHNNSGALKVLKLIFILGMIIGYPIILFIFVFFEIPVM